MQKSHLMCSSQEKIFVLAKKSANFSVETRKKHVVNALKRDVLRHGNFNSAVFSLEKN